MCYSAAINPKAAPLASGLPPATATATAGGSSCATCSGHKASGAATAAPGDPLIGDSWLRAYLDPCGTGLVDRTWCGRLDAGDPAGIRVCLAAGGAQLLAVAALCRHAALTAAAQRQLRQRQLRQLQQRGVAAWSEPGQPGWGVVQVDGCWQFETVAQLQAAVAKLAQSAAGGKAAPPSPRASRQPCGDSQPVGSCPAVAVARPCPPPPPSRKRAFQPYAAPAAAAPAPRDHPPSPARPAESSGSCCSSTPHLLLPRSAAEAAAQVPGALLAAPGRAGPLGQATAAAAAARSTADTADSGGGGARSRKRPRLGLSAFQSAPPAFGCTAPPPQAGAAGTPAASQLSASGPGAGAGAAPRHEATSVLRPLAAALPTFSYVELRLLADWLLRPAPRAAHHPAICHPWAAAWTGRLL